MWSRPESNWNPGLRRPLYYPLYYRTNNSLFRSPLSEGGRNYELFQQPLPIRAEYFDGDRQQDHPEELADGDHPGGSQQPLDGVHGLEDDKDKDQVEEDAQQDGRSLEVGFQRHDGRQGTRSGDQWKCDRHDYGGFCIRLSFEKFDAEYHFQSQDKDHDRPSYRKRALIHPEDLQE